MLGAALAHGEGIKASGESVDVMQLDLRGIKLGMAQEEALRLIGEKFPEAALKEHQSEELMTGLHGKKFVQAIEVKGDGDEELAVLFAPNVLERKPGELIVAQVAMRLPSGQLAQLQKSAVEKYGAPTAIGGRGDYYWCDLKGKKACDELQPQLQMTKAGENIEFGLVNFALEKAAFSAAKKPKKEAGGKIEL